MAEGKYKQAPDTPERLRRLYELALTVAGNPVQVFDHVVRIIAELFGVRVALIERLEGDKIVTLSMYLDGRVMHEGVFDPAGTPCENVRASRAFCAFNNAAEQFPQDTFLREYGLSSYIGLPVISSEGEVIAVINAMSDRPINLTDDDKLFLEAMVSRVRLELERANQATESQIVRMLLEVSQEISKLRAVDETLQLLTERAKDLLNVDVAAIATLDDKEGNTSWKAIVGFKTDVYRDTKFAPGKGTAGRAVAARRTVVLEGIGENPDLPAEEFPIQTAERVRNAFGVPMLVQDRVLGVLIAGYRSDVRITEQQIRIAEALAGQAIVSLENARLFTELGRANERLLEIDRLKTEMIQELSTPVIPIWDRILLAPLIGTMTANRAQQVTTALLERASESHVEVIILDITGVRLVDTEAAQYLRNTVAAAKVLGAQSIITGIGAAIAQPLVQLGVTFEGIHTRRKLSDGLHLALELIGLRTNG
ncbi:MAG TPA: GAF domain-containing protein [Blastocatellia bacterium]|nr:GAF domain-containing protein [Blastocatellia bacterium]